MEKNEQGSKFGSDSLHISLEYPMHVAVSSWLPTVSIIPECKSYLKGLQKDQITLLKL